MNNIISSNTSVLHLIKQVIRLSIPAILAEITSVIMQYIDAGMVGSLGRDATAAIGLISTSTWLIGGLCISVSVGFSVQVAQLIGAEKANDILWYGTIPLAYYRVFFFLIDLVYNIAQYSDR